MHGFTPVSPGSAVWPSTEGSPLGTNQQSLMKFVYSFGSWPQLYGRTAAENVFKKTEHPRTVDHWKVSFPPAPKFKSYLLRQFRARHRISHGRVWGISSSSCLADSLPEQMPLENNILSRTHFARAHLSAPRGEPFISQPHNDSRAAVKVAVFTCMNNPVKMRISATPALICSLPASTAIQEVSRNPLSKEPVFGILL